MDITPNIPRADSTTPGSQRSVSAFFESSRGAGSAAKALTDAGFTAEEIIQTEQNGGYLVTVENTARASDVAAVFKQHDGSLSGDFSAFAEDLQAAAAPVDEEDESAARSLPPDSGLSDPVTDRPAGGGTYSPGSSAGGSGSGTASGGSMFGSSR